MFLNEYRILNFDQRTEKCDFFYWVKDTLILADKGKKFFTNER